MQCLWNALLLSVVCLIAVLVSPGSCDPSISGSGEGNVIGRPSRPQVFASPEELRTYLEQLSNYFAIAGRPRFGKRLAPSLQYRPTLKKMTEYNSNSLEDSDDVQTPRRYNRYPASNSDLYQLLAQYDE